MNYAIDNERKGTQAVGVEEIYGPIESQMMAVDQLLKEQIDSSSGPIAQRLAASGLASGKRIRPAMLLLVGGCFSDLKKTHVAAAAALELVHVATLVHDDVLDRADERRHEPSLNSLCDNSTAILTGDYLFSKAFEVACATGSMESVRQIAQSSCDVCEGEIQQNLSMGNFELTQAEYFKIISMKTARLCRVACGIGGVLSECEKATIEKLEKFGEDLGLAFQIIDDVLDIVGQQQSVGKTLGTDLSNKKMTLPMIHCLAEYESVGKRDEMLAKLEDGMTAEQAMDCLNETQSIAFAREIACRHANAALEFTTELKESNYSVALKQLAEFVLSRTH